MNFKVIKSALTISLFFLVHIGFAQQVKVEVIDFHSNFRCITCKAIEANAKKTVDELSGVKNSSAKVSFKVYNIDEPANKSIAEEFQASGTGLFLRIIRDNKSEIVDLTRFAFMNARNEEKFIAGLKEEIERRL